jgi:hypothetical protein
LSSLSLMSVMSAIAVALIQSTGGSGGEERAEPKGRSLGNCHSDSFQLKPIARLFASCIEAKHLTDEAVGRGSDTLYASGATAAIIDRTSIK